MADFDHLPTLTPDQASTVGAFLSGRGSIVELAERVGMPLSTFLDLLAAPAVQAHLRHARDIVRQRASHQLADAAELAVDVLRELATNPENDKTERRRAATTLIRAYTIEHRPRRRPRSHAPYDPTDRIADLAAELTAAETTPIDPRHTPQEAGSANNSTTSPNAALQQAGNDQPEARFKPRQGSNRASSEHRQVSDAKAAARGAPSRAPPTP